MIMPFPPKALPAVDWANAGDENISRVDLDSGRGSGDAHHPEKARAYHGVRRGGNGGVGDGLGKR